MPFSRDAFLDIFAIYNGAWWPAALALWIATLVAFVIRVDDDYKRDEWTFGLIAFQWAWSAIAYHANLFSRINPTAWLFALLFLIEASLFVWYGVAQRRLRFSAEDSTPRFFGYALVVYGLLYPFIALLGDHAYPRVPTFGVPCPTTIVTVGFLMLVRDRIPAALVVVPLLWAAIGGSAAFLFGVRADFVLPAAGLILALRTWSMRPAACA
jgi:Family of unknown function (DUF6064)